MTPTKENAMKTPDELIHEAIDAVNAQCKGSRERSLVVTKLEEAYLWLSQVEAKELPPEIANEVPHVQSSIVQEAVPQPSEPQTAA